MRSKRSFPYLVIHSLRSCLSHLESQETSFLMSRDCKDDTSSEVLGSMRTIEEITNNNVRRHDIPDKDPKDQSKNELLCHYITLTLGGNEKRNIRTSESKGLYEVYKRSTSFFIRTNTKVISPKFRSLIGLFFQ